jgi:NRPS condensation-like uncharacterized protein
MQAAHPDAFRLSPVQQGILTHHLHHPKSDAGVVQLVLSLGGPLRPELLQQAWERVVAHHQILRTSVRWVGLREPFQLVNRQVQVPWTVRDESGKADAVAAFLAADRARRLDPGSQPLFRLCLLQTAGEEHALVWTWHRLILDRRSALRVAGEALTLYHALVRGESGALAPERPFRDLAEAPPCEDPAETERFWRHELAQAAIPPPPGAPAPPAVAREEMRERTLRLPADLTAALAALSRDAGITAETLAQGAWALLLAGNASPEAVFGVTLGAESAETLGPLSQTLPLRVPLAPEAPLIPWLQALRDRQATLRRHGHVPLKQIEKWSGRAPLFHSQVVDETLPASLAPPGAAGSKGSEIAVREVRLIEPFPSPLALAVRSGPELELRLVYDPRQCAEAESALRLERLAAILKRFSLRQRLAETAHRAAAPEAKGNGAPEIAPEIAPVPRHQPLPATFFQEWASQLDQVTTNCIPHALMLDGSIDLRALRRSMTAMVRRHEALRTTFVWEDGELRQVIAPPDGTAPPVVDLSALAEPRRTEVMDRLTSEFAEQVFDLARGPLFLSRILRLSPQQHALLMNLHHLIADGWSLQVLRRDLFLDYKARLEKRPPSLPPLPLQPADYAWWQRRVYAAASLPGHLAWWRTALGHLPPPPELPIDRPRGEILGPDVVHASLTLAPGPAQALRAYALETRCSLPMIILAAVNAMLYTYSGEEDQVITTAFAGRNRQELCGLVGLFLNMLPIRTDLSGNPSFRELTARVRTMMVEAYERQDVPFPRVLAEVLPGRRLTRTTLSGVCLNMLSFSSAGDAQGAGAARAGDSLRARPFFSPKESAKYELVVHGQESETDMTVGLTGAANLFRGEKLADMAERLKGILLEAVRDPGIPLDRLRLKVGLQTVYSI